MARSPFDALRAIAKKAEGTIYEERLAEVFLLTKQIASETPDVEKLTRFHEKYTQNFVSLYQLLFSPDINPPKNCNASDFSWFFFKTANMSDATFCLSATNSPVSHIDAFLLFINQKNPEHLVTFYAGVDAAGDPILYSQQAGWVVYRETKITHTGMIFCSRDNAEESVTHINRKRFVEQFIERFVNIKPRLIDFTLVTYLYSQYKAMVRQAAGKVVPYDIHLPEFGTLIQEKLIAAGFWTKQNKVKYFLNKVNNAELVGPKKYFEDSYNRAPDEPNFPRYE